MKSEMFTGIEFEYSLDRVLFEKYDSFLSEEYIINLDYLEDHFKELLQLRDVVIPNRLFTPREIRKAIANRTIDDWGGNRKWNLRKEHGIYMWMELFSREVSRTIDEKGEDDLRLALDIVKKYPEHKDLVIKREEE